MSLYSPSTSLMKKLRGGLLFGLGYLLSPLCWWNDLIFNLPVAYGFGYLCHLISEDWFIPGAIAGYWLSNIVGILLMQFGVVDVFQKKPGHSFKQELLTGVLSSTAYTALIVALVQFNVLTIPDLTTANLSFDLSSLFSFLPFDLSSLFPSLSTTK
jgi:hypothetical protein